MTSLTDEELIAHLRLQGLDKDVAAADRIEELVRDRKFILDERDRTFALMLTRTETAEASLAKAVKLIGYAIELGRFELNPKLLDDLIHFKTEIELEKTE